MCVCVCESDSEVFFVFEIEACQLELVRICCLVEDVHHSVVAFVTRHVVLTLVLQVLFALL